MCCLFIMFSHIRPSTTTPTTCCCGVPAIDLLYTPPAMHQLLIGYGLAMHPLCTGCAAGINRICTGDWPHKAPNHHLCAAVVYPLWICYIPPISGYDQPYAGYGPAMHRLLKGYGLAMYRLCTRCAPNAIVMEIGSGWEKQDMGNSYTHC